MKLMEKLELAFQRALIRSGGKTGLAKQTGVAYSMIHRFSTGECRFCNMTVGTLEKMFPEMEIDFYGELHPSEPELPAEYRCLNLEKQNLMLERRIFALERELWHMRHKEDGNPGTKTPAGQAGECEF